MQLSHNKKVFILLFATLIVRVLTVFIIGKTPCMDPNYLAQANHIINSVGKVDIYITPSYGFLLYFINIFTKSLFLSSSIIYIFFSFGISLMAYFVAKELFNEKTGIVALILLLFFPCITVAVAGYSHTSIVSSFFILLSIYTLVKFTLSKTGFVYSALLFSFSTIIGTYIRPESAFILLILALMIFWRNGLPLKQKVYFLLLSYFLVISGVFLHGAFIKNRSSSPYASTFSDAKYIYITYVCVFSDMRSMYNGTSAKANTSNGSASSDSVSLALSTEAFGTPESNNWSIRNAIMKNPKVALVHCFYILKQCLFYFGHPLFCPVYMYFVAGIGLYFLFRQKQIFTTAFLALMFFISLIPLLFAHAEIRYLMNCVYPVIFMAAVGIAQFESKKATSALIISVSAANFIIYLMYLVNNARLGSLCG